MDPLCQQSFVLYIESLDALPLTTFQHADPQLVGDVLSHPTDQYPYAVTACCCVYAQGCDQIAWQQPGPVGSDTINDAASILPLASQDILGGEDVLTQSSPAEANNHADLEDLALAVSTRSAHAIVAKPCKATGSVQGHVYCYCCHQFGTLPIWHFFVA